MVCSSRRTVALSYPYWAKHLRAPSRICRRRAARWSSVTRGNSGPSLNVGDASPSGLEHVAQHVLQDAAVAVVVRLAGGVDAHHGVELDFRSVVLRGRHVNGLRRLALVQFGDARDVERLGAVELEARRRLTGRELQRD